jgi:hypothetical protein
MTNNVIVDEIRQLSPTTILGDGFRQSPSQAARTAHLIAVDAGSYAPGRCYLTTNLRRQRVIE